MFIILNLIVLFILLSKISSLSKKITELDTRLALCEKDSKSAEVSTVDNLQQTYSIPQVVALDNQQGTAQVTQSAQSVYTQENMSDSANVVLTELDVTDRLFEWFKNNWLLKLGVFLMLLGFGWFVSYALIYGWIGPVERIVLGMTVGAMLALYALIHMSKSQVQGELFLVLGSGLFLMTSYAAYAVYGYFAGGLFWIIAFATSLYLSYVSYVFNLRSIAIYGVVIAYFIPMLVQGNTDVLVFSVYLVIVACSSLWLSTIKEWMEIRSVALTGFCIGMMTHLLSPLNQLESYIVLLSSYGVGVVFFVGTLLLSSLNKKMTDSHGIYTHVLVTGLIYIATVFLISEGIKSVVYAVWAVVFLVGGSIAYQQTKMQYHIYLTAIIAMLFVVTTLVRELEGGTLIYASFVVGVLISLSGYFATQKVHVGYNLAWFMVWPGILSLPSFTSSAWSTGIFHDDFGVLLTGGIIFVGLGYFYFLAKQAQIKSEHEEITEQWGDTILMIIGSWYLLILVWICSYAYFASEKLGSCTDLLTCLFVSDARAVLVSLVTYTILGIGLYFSGTVYENKTLKQCGGILLVLVVGRLLLVDVWNMQLSLRIVTFMLIGLLFISTAFYGKKMRGEHIELSDTK